jgi:hypothetical protein
MRWFTLILLACVAAGPATKPDFPEPRQIVTSIPKDVLPDASREWDEIAGHKLDKWLKDQVVGKTLKITFKLGKLFPEKEGPSTLAGFVKVTRDRREFLVEVDVGFAPEAEDWLEKQKQGRTITVQATIGEAKIYGQGRSGNGNAGPAISVRLVGADPRPSK